MIEIAAPGARPMGAILSPDGKTLFVSNGRGKSVSIIDIATTKVTATIDDVGVRPWGIAVSADGSKLYTANGPSNDLSVIDVAKRAVLKRIPVGGSPWGITIRRAQ
jgi:YVTN family beta-propeller protein